MQCSGSRVKICVRMERHWCEMERIRRRKRGSCRKAANDSSLGDAHNPMGYGHRPG
jgi:hypothetical protein